MNWSNKPWGTHLDEAVTRAAAVGGQQVIADLDILGETVAAMTDGIGDSARPWLYCPTGMEDPQPTEASHAGDRYPPVKKFGIGATLLVDDRAIIGAQHSLGRGNAEVIEIPLKDFSAVRHVSYSKLFRSGTGAHFELRARSRPVLGLWADSSVDGGLFELLVSCLAGEVRPEFDDSTGRLVGLDPVQ